MGELIPECTVPYVGLPAGRGFAPSPCSPAPLLLPLSSLLGRFRNRRTWDPTCSTTILIYHTAVGNNFSLNFSAPVDARVYFSANIRPYRDERARARNVVFFLPHSLVRARTRRESYLYDFLERRPIRSNPGKRNSRAARVIMYSRSRCSNRGIHDGRGGWKGMR